MQTGKVVAVLVVAFVLVLAGVFIGISSRGGWNVTSAALAAVVALLLVIVAFAVHQNAKDGDPMPESQRRFLAMYLVSLSVVLIYLVFALMTVHFPDTQPGSPSQPPALPPSARPTNNAVAIAEVRPNPIVAEQGPVNLQVFGYNFTTELKTASGDAGAAAEPGAAGGTEAGAGRGGPSVTFDTRRTPTLATDQLLVVPLTADDVGHPRAVTVKVVGANGTTAETTVSVVGLNGELHVLNWRPTISREMQLLLLVIVAGALGSFVHAIRSLTAYIGNRQAVASWFWFYVTKPFDGIALAVVFYAAIRGGFVAGSPADVKSVNPFGVFAIAAMVGMFADKAANKLAEIFDALFRSASDRQNPLSTLAIATASLPHATVNAPFTATIAVTGGTPQYTFGLLNAPSWLTINPSSGALSGTPTQRGDEAFEVTVADAKTSRTSKPYTLTVV